MWFLKSNWSNLFLMFVLPYSGARRVGCDRQHMLGEGWRIQDRFVTLLTHPTRSVRLLPAGNSSTATGCNSCILHHTMLCFSVSQRNAGSILPLTGLQSILLPSSRTSGWFTASCSHRLGTQNLGKSGITKKAQLYQWSMFRIRLLYRANCSSQLRYISLTPPL